MKILFIASEHFDYWTEYKGKKTKVINLDAREAVKDLIHQAVAEERERIKKLIEVIESMHKPFAMHLPSFENPKHRYIAQHCKTDGYNEALEDLKTIIRNLA